MKLESFSDFPLSIEVLRGVEDLGFTSLFPIQAEAILPLLEGKDVIGQAQTGTGKTAAFGIPMVENMKEEVKGVQALVLVPTRELALQVSKHIALYAKYKNLRVLPVYGGTSINRQIHALRRGVQIVVGTPGRLIDLIERRVLNLDSVRVLVLDEADRMLDMGFIEDIEYILSKVPSERQTELFSATIDKSVLRICNRFMKNPEKILVSRDEIALTQIKQYFMVLNPHNKLQTLGDILDENHMGKAIIFCKTRKTTSYITKKLRNQGYRAGALHAGFTQAQREFVTDQFRKGIIQLLVATDVASRGLDIQGITHIINYDVPLEPLVYFHRIGRTARMGDDGTAITLVGYGEIIGLNRIKALTKTNIEELAYPCIEA